VISRPSESEYAPAYAAYVDKVAKDEDVLGLLARQREQLASFPSRIAGERETYRYADGKWSVREVIGHLGDGERVFGYRIFCISRGETQSLPGFDENVYAERSGSAERPIAELVAELLHLRDANLSLLRRLSAEAWARSGVANSKPISLRALVFVLAGHCEHHFGVLAERYGVSVR
jgi:DinB family protein